MEPLEDISSSEEEAGIDFAIEPNNRSNTTEEDRGSARRKLRKGEDEEGEEEEVGSSRNNKRLKRGHHHRSNSKDEDIESDQEMNGDQSNGTLVNHGQLEASLKDTNREEFVRLILQALQEMNYT